MRTHLEFESKSFPPYSGEDDQINPRRFGRRLAEFVADALSANGFVVEGISAEDWGWMVQLRNKEFPLWVGCGNYEEFKDGFLCFIEPSKPLVRRWFSNTETGPLVEKVASAIEAALAESDKASRLRWWREDEVRT